MNSWMKRPFHAVGIISAVVVCALIGPQAGVGSASAVVEGEASAGVRPPSMPVTRPGFRGRLRLRSVG